MQCCIAEWCDSDSAENLCIRVKWAPLSAPFVPTLGRVYFRMPAPVSPGQIWATFELCTGEPVLDSMLLSLLPLLISLSSNDLMDYAPILWLQSCLEHYGPRTQCLPDLNISPHLGHPAMAILCPSNKAGGQDKIAS